MVLDWRKVPCTEYPGQVFAKTPALPAKSRLLRHAIFPLWQRENNLAVTHQLETWALVANLDRKKLSISSLHAKLRRLRLGVQRFVTRCLPVLSKGQESVHVIIGRKVSTSFVAFCIVNQYACRGGRHA